jgi:DNA-binding response OmpR family regulator
VPRLLIIDDEIEIREAISGVFGSHFEILTASSGIEGLMAAAALRPDLIILDLLMPGMDGTTVCRQLRANANTRQIPIIVMTAIEDDNQRAAALLAGADDLTSKPFRPKEFLIRIENQLRNSQKNQGEILESKVLFCGNLTLDLKKFEAKIDSRSVDLSVSEFSIIKLLVENKDRILNRSEIINTVWIKRNISNRVVDNQILCLRKKLLGFNCEIVSVYGMGYGLKCQSN